MAWPENFSPVLGIEGLDCSEENRIKSILVSLDEQNTFGTEKSCPASLDPKLAHFEVLDPGPLQSRIDESFV
jgi:hypothetical protein